MSTKSRYGYHSTDFDTYQKLKLIAKYYWITLKQYADWVRWKRKYPENRVVRLKKRNEKGEVVGYDILPRPEPKVCPLYLKFRNRWYKDNDMGYSFVEDYRNAKTPKSSEEELTPLNHSLDEINQLYFNLKEYLGI